MPHVIIKMYKGRTDAQKEALVAAFTKDLVEIAGVNETAVSVAFEDYAKEDWPEAVYRPDILEYDGNLLKAPGYPNPLADKS